LITHFNAFSTAVENFERDESHVGRDAGRVGVRAADNSGQVRAVAVIVHRVGVVVDEVMAGDDAFARSEAAAEVGVIVIDAGVENGDRVTRAAIRIDALHRVQADDGAKIAGRREAVFQGFDGQARWIGGFGGMTPDEV
jgi:hypothetical protein